jgi:mRNA-degrading endonuclease toxin of MazEF toxin-antitoxin module
VNLVRGGVYFAELPGVGDKPVVVVSWDAVNRAGLRPIAARITSAERRRSLPTFVELERGEGGLSEPSYVLAHELFTLPPTAFRRRSGELSLGKLIAVEAALRAALDLG